MLTRIVLLIAILCGLATPADAQVRIRRATPAATNSPISDNIRPRFLMTSTAAGDYGADFNTVSEVRAKINASQTLRTFIAEMAANLDSIYLTIAPRITSCTVATPTVCTFQEPHGLVDASTVLFHGHTSTPDLNSRYFNVTRISDTQVSLQEYPEDTNVTVSSDSGGGAMVAAGGDTLRERAMEFAFLYQILKDGVLRNAADTADVTHTYTYTQYGEKAVDVAHALIAAESNGEGVAGYAGEGAYPTTINPAVLDWTWELWDDDADRSDYCDYMYGSTAISGWVGDHAWTTQGALARAYIGAAAVVCVGFGHSQNTFWQNTLDNFATINAGDLESYVSSVGAISDGLDFAIPEGASYLAYSFAHVFPDYAAHRIGMGITKSTFYLQEDWSQYVFAPQGFALLSLPYGYTNTNYPDGEYFGMVRGHYAHLSSDNVQFNEIGWGLFPLLNGEMPHLMTANNMDGLAMWMQNHRNTMNLAKGSGAGLGPAAGVGWILRSILADETVTEESPSTVGLDLSHYMTNQMHIFRGSLTDEDGTLVTFNVHKRSTGVATGRSPHVQTGSFAMERKGPIVACQGGISHNGSGGRHCRMMFPRIDRVRQDEASLEADGSKTDDIGDVRTVSVNSVYPHTNATDWADDNPTDMRGEHRYAYADQANGRDIDYVLLDNTKAYYYSTAVDDASNPDTVDYAKTSFFHLRGADGNDPIIVIRIDRWGLDAGAVGTYEPILNIVPSADAPTVTGGGSATPFSRQGTTTCQSHYGAATTVNWSSTTAAFGAGYNYNLQGNMTILAPSSRQVIMRGGPNESAEKWYNGPSDGHTTNNDPDNSCEYVDPTGHRWGPSANSSTDYTGYKALEVGSRIIETRDTSGAQTGYFLTAIEGLDSGGTPTSCSLLTSLTTVTGAVCGTKVVVAGQGTSMALTSGAFTIPTGAATYEVLITDLDPGSSRGVSCTNTSSVTQITPTDAASPFTVSNTGEDKGQIYLVIVATGNAACTIS